MALPVRARRRPQPRVWESTGELETAVERMSDLFEQTFGGWPSWPFDLQEGFTPPADLEETDDAYILEVELPGVNKDDIDIEIHGRRVTISGERKERERTGVLRHRSRVTGRFIHEAVLPGDIDEAQTSASIDEGVLTVRVPKAAQERERSKKIEVT